MKERITNIVTKLVSKSLDGKLEVILLNLKEVSEMMGVEFRVKDDALIS